MRFACRKAVSVLREARKVNVGDFRLKLPCNSGQKRLSFIKLTEVYNHLEEFFRLLMGKLLTCDDIRKLKRRNQTHPVNFAVNTVYELVPDKILPLRSIQPHSAV